MTALNDAALSAVAATLEYSKILMVDDYAVNGATFVITDGDDNASNHAAPGDIADRINKALAAENIIESYNTFLIGINVEDIDMKMKLEEFKIEAEFTDFVAADDASPDTLSKIAQFVSQSISSQSKKLGSGGAAASIPLVL
jgi:hypothetical protein